MLIKYKDAAYNNKIENLRNNGYTVNFVDFDYDDFVMEEGNPVPFIELQLPNGGKSYNDYSAIVAWSDYLENEDNPDVPTDFDRTHSGMPVPSSFTVQDGDTPVSCYFVLEDTATEGVVRFSFAATSQGPFSNEDFSDFVGNIDGLMFIEGHEYALDPDTSLIVPNLEAFFAQASGTADFQLDIANKTKLLSFGDNEAFSAYRYYKIIPSIPHGESSVIEFDGTSYHTESSSYQLLPLPIEGALNLRGYTEDELETTDVAEIYQTAEENSSIFEDTVTNEAFGCLHLQEPLIYPISRPLTLRSNIRIVGNGSTIMAYNMANNSGTYVAEEMSIIENSIDGLPVSNVAFADLTFKGTYPFLDEHGTNIIDEYGNFVGDQCLATNADYSAIQNLVFEKVTFDGFKFAVHTSSDSKSEPEWTADWKFNNCDIINSATGFKLSWIRNLTVTNTHIDNSAGINDKQHCVYMSDGCSHVSFDNCLLENSLGTGLDHTFAGEFTDKDFSHNNSFTNLQIRNCNIGMNIGSPVRDIVIKNIFVTNVGRALELHNCKNVVIDNFNASGCFYYDYFLKRSDDEIVATNSDAEWCAIMLLGFVEAKITNSFFSTGGLLFHSGKTFFPSYLGQKVESRLEFDNCIFSTTFSEYKPGSAPGSYYQPESCLGVHTTAENGLTQYYRYEVDFKHCQFLMNSENNERSMIALKGYDGNDGEKSVYNFTDCLVAYRDGNGNPKDDHPDKADSMPEGYFVEPQEGSFATIKNCIFYSNRERAEGSCDYGFVRDELKDENDESVVRYQIVFDTNDHSKNLE